MALRWRLLSGRQLPMVTVFIRNSRGEGQLCGEVVDGSAILGEGMERTWAPRRTLLHDAFRRGGRACIPADSLSSTKLSEPKRTSSEVREGNLVDLQNSSVATSWDWHFLETDGWVRYIPQYRYLCIRIAAWCIGVRTPKPVLPAKEIRNKPTGSWVPTRLDRRMHLSRGSTLETTPAAGIPHCGRVVPRGDTRPQRKYAPEKS